MPWALKSRVADWYWSVQSWRLPSIKYSNSAIISELASRPHLDLDSCVKVGRHRRVILFAKYFLIFATVVLFVAWVLTHVVTLRPESDSESWIYTFLVLVPLVGMFVAEAILLQRYDRKLARETVVTTLVSIIGKLDSNETLWLNRSYMVKLNARVLRLAFLVERSWWVGQTGDRTIDRRLRTEMAGRAASIRELTVWIFSPQETTRGDLLATLRGRLEMALAGRWLDFPTLEVTVRRWAWLNVCVRWLALVAVVGGVALFGTFWPNLTSQGGLVSVVVGAIIVALLGRLGISPDVVSVGARIANDSRDEKREA